MTWRSKMKRRLCKKVLKYKILGDSIGAENRFKAGDYSQVGKVTLDATKGKKFSLQQAAVSYFTSKILKYVKQ